MSKLSASTDVLITDVAIGIVTDAVADAHDLPFADDTFDAVVAQAVLEHVLDPARCVAEIHRVLKPSGYVYAETPFMQQVHMGRYDFTRYTALGHRWLFRQFSEIEVGIGVGPGSAAAWSLTYLLASFARNRRQHRLLRAAGQALFFWLRFLDGHLSKNEAGWDAASGFYFIGQKTLAPHLTAKALIASYRGAV